MPCYYFSPIASFKINCSGKGGQVFASTDTLTPKQLETHGRLLNNVVTDDLVLKRQAIGIPSADQILALLNQNITFKVKVSQQILFHFERNNPVS